MNNVITLFLTQSVIGLDKIDSEADFFSGHSLSIQMPFLQHLPTGQMEKMLNHYHTFPIIFTFGISKNQTNKLFSKASPLKHILISNLKSTIIDLEQMEQYLDECTEAYVANVIKFMETLDLSKCNLAEMEFEDDIFKFADIVKISIIYELYINLYVGGNISGYGNYLKMIVLFIYEMKSDKNTITDYLNHIHKLFQELIGFNAIHQLQHFEAIDVEVPTPKSAIKNTKKKKVVKSCKKNNF